VGNAYTVVVPGGVGVDVVAAAADEVAVGGEVGGGVGPVVGGVEGAVVAHRNEAWAGMGDHTQDQAGDSAFSPVPVLVAIPSPPGSGGSEQGSVEEAGYRDHYIRSVEGRNAVKASEEEDTYNDAHTIHTSEHWMGEDTSNPSGVADTDQVEGGAHGMGDGREGAMDPAPAPGQEQEQAQAQGDVGDELAGVAVEGNVQAVEVDSDHIH